SFSFQKRMNLNLAPGLAAGDAVATRYSPAFCAEAVSTKHAKVATATEHAAKVEILIEDLHVHVVEGPQWAGWRYGRPIRASFEPLESVPRHDWSLLQRERLPCAISASKISR